MLLPINVKAQEKITYQTPSYFTQEDVLFRPSDEVVEVAQKKFEAARPRPVYKTASYGRYSCVAWAKQVTGVFGTWGNGARYLSLNSTGLIGDVVVFKYTHTAVVIDRVGEILTITEANYHLDGKVTIRQISAFDSTIKGFHRF